MGYSRKPGFTATRLRPLARRREITARPLLVFMRVRNPCVFERRRRLGWNVRFGMRNCAPHWENSHWDKLKVYRLAVLPSKLRTWCRFSLQAFETSKDAQRESGLGAVNATFL